MDDEALRRGIVDALAHDRAAEAARIGVTVANGVVTLTGVVDDQAERIAAAQAVRLKRAGGLAGFLAGPARAHPSDDELAGRVRTAIAWHRHAPDRAIAVQVASGWVRLTGLVDDPYERREAEAAVAKLDGVVGISNLIEVAGRDHGATIAFARPAGA